MAAGAHYPEEVSGRRRAVMRVERVAGRERHHVAEPPLLELVSGGVDEGTVRKLVPTVDPADPAVQQTQMAPAVGPAQFRLNRFGHFPTAPVGPTACEPHPAPD